MVLPSQQHQQSQANQEQKQPQSVQSPQAFSHLSTEQQALCRAWQAQIVQAGQAGTSLAICGFGSKAFHPCSVLVEGASDASIQTPALSGVLAYEPSELVVTVLAGTPLSELQALLAEKNQCLPFEPPHYDSASVGGMVASGLAGPARVSVGGVRDYVLGAHIINGQGQALRFGGTVIKNVAGYDVSRLMVGSWGQLGVITQVSLKVLSRRLAWATLRFDWSQAQALEQLACWQSQALPINASYWLMDDAHAHLYVRLAGSPQAVDAACTTMGGERLEQTQVTANWQALREQSLPFFTQTAQQHPDWGLWRLSLPLGTPELPFADLGLAHPLLEWHGAQRWVFAPLAQQSALAQLAHSHGGWASVFRWPSAANQAEKAAVPPSRSTHTDLENSVRLAFDPQQVFANAGHASHPA